MNIEEQQTVKKLFEESLSFKMSKKFPSSITLHREANFWETCSMIGYIYLFIYLFLSFFI